MVKAFVTQTFASADASDSWGRLFITLLGLTTVLTICGTLVLTLNWLPEEFGWFGSVILFLSALVIAVSERRVRTTRTVLVEALTIGIGALVLEFVGMHTGYPFGKYSYTDVLGVRVAGVPLAIGAAWYVTLLCTRRIAQSSSARPVRHALVAALLTLAFDVALEPMAWHVTKYWQWHSEQIPLQNYVSWFLVSFIAVGVMEYREKVNYRAPSDPVRRTALLILMLYVVLFNAVNLVNGFVEEVFVSGTMIGLLLALATRERPFFTGRSANAS